MTRGLFLFLLFFSIVALLFVQSSRARGELSVDEAATVITFKELAPELLLATVNGTGKPIDAAVRVEFIDTSNKVETTFSQNVTINPGRQKLSLTLPLRTRDFSPNENSRILWYRLRYVITPLQSNQAEPVQGVISISQITPDLFELRIAKPGYVGKGMGCRALVTTLHPITRKPIQDVEVKGLIKIEDKRSHTERRVTASARTNSEGFAYLDFTLPKDIEQSALELVVDATRGLLTADASETLSHFNPLSLIASTDKPLYQPGQTLFTRVLVFDSTRRIVPGIPVTLEIKDGDSEVVFKADLETSRFGIAKSEWTIPDSTKLGDYQLEFETASGDRYSSQVKVSRYELPNFAVKVDTDRTYYLNDQNASVTVKADYLFGKPVTRGHVKVVRETERRWNYREQRYDIEEADKYEGEVDGNGQFKTLINLSADHDSVKEGTYYHYRDITYTAYFTDASTNRTEQKRFDLRLTKDPIHVYVITPNYRYGGKQGLPLTLYVSTYFADGTPASCEVEIFASEDKDEDAAEKATTVGKVRTNKYGLAKVDNLRLPELKDPDSGWHLELVATGKDRKIGRRQEDIDSDDEPEARITTAKTIFAPGESIEAQVSVTQPNSLVTVGLLRDLTLVHSQIIRPSSRTVSVSIPYKPEFKGELTLVASVVEGSDVKASGSRTIVFPHNRDLQLNLEAGAKTYLPGEQASVNFRTVNSAGRQVESALGVVVVDQAIQERFNTDVDYAWSYLKFDQNAHSFIGSTEGLGPITRRSLHQLDTAKPIAPEIDLAAEMLLNNRERYSPSFFTSEYDNMSWSFSTLLETQWKPIQTGLKEIYERTKVYPRNESSFRQLVSGLGIDFDKFFDPWGTNYRLLFSIDGPLETLNIRSAGPDKRFDTADDFTATSFSWPYFAPMGQQIKRAFDEYHKRTGGYIRDYQTLRDELLRSNVDLDALRDRWGNKYKFNFSVNGKYYTLLISTFSPTRVQSAWGNRRHEFEILKVETQYFAEYEAKIDSALAKHAMGGKEPPGNVSELASVLKAAGIELSAIRDPWGANYYHAFSSTAFYADKTTVTTIQDKTGPIQRTNIKPVTRRMAFISFRSIGPDQTEGTQDDYTVASFYSMAADQSAQDFEPVKPKIVTTSTGYTSVIMGTVVDANGAVISGATVMATRNGWSRTFAAESDAEGKFFLRNLEPGVYELRVSASGFKPVVVSSIVVGTATSVQVELVLKVGEVTEVVNVVGESSLLLSTNAASVSEVRKVFSASQPSARQQLSTPRIRGHFPETLLWQPELTTDKKGRAQLNFKLADNITTWKVSVIGSTAEGEVGIAETDIRAFQPFFAELDPPRVLTEGDRISLPVVLRNYLEKKQRVDLEIKPDSWFSVTSSNHQIVDVPAGDSKTPTFDLKAIASVKDGKQRVTAISPEYSDAIEKPTTVHPDGEEVAESQGDLLSSSASVQLNLPPNVIPGSARTELKVYPNLMGHVWESVEGIMQRPYGCAEQTISSTYPSLLVLRYMNKEEQNTSFARKARGYFEMGYQRLLTYQRPDGSFGYWGSGETDIALTAYAIRFLQDARSVTPANSNALFRANDWLIKQQQTDGRWRAVNWRGEEYPLGSRMLTAVVARSLALQLKGANLSDSATASLQKSLKLSFSYLDRKSKEIDEPYLIACYALALSLAGESARAEEVAVQLQDLAHSERTGSYWSLETNTPFYGWGMTGRVETTALVVNALATIKATNETDAQKRRTLQTRGLLFLMRKKDRYGCWYSTQATINVLDAMLALLSSTASTVNSEVQILVNGVQRGSLTLPNTNKTSGPLMVDVSQFVQHGSNQIELRRAGDGPIATLQAVTTYYIPWRNSSSSEVAAREVNNERLSLETVYDKTNGKVMEEITCRVKAERIGYRGYGMLLAEIGLPPGADVDRASLEAAKAGSGWDIGRYDVLPDRVVVYLWPRAGGSEFSFKFKPRMAMTAKSAASTIYDYYNPEANAVVAPTTFTVR